MRVCTYVRKDPSFGNISEQFGEHYTRFWKYCGRRSAIKMLIDYGPPSKI